MVESEQKEVPPLDYEVPRKDRQSVHAVEFWGTYGASTLIGNVVLEPMLANALWGRPGDQVVGAFTLMSIGVVTAIAVALHWTCLRRCPLWFHVTVAALLGLGSFLPGYGILFAFV